MRALASILVLSSYAAAYVHASAPKAVTFETELRPIPLVKGTTGDSSTLVSQEGGRISLFFVDRMRVCGDVGRPKTFNTLLQELLPCGEGPVEHLLRIQLCQASKEQNGRQDAKSSTDHLNPLPTARLPGYPQVGDCQETFSPGAISQDLSESELNCLLKALPLDSSEEKKGPVLEIKVDVTAKTVELERAPDASPNGTPAATTLLVIQGQTSVLRDEQARTLLGALKTAAKKLEP